MKKLSSALIMLVLVCAGRPLSAQFMSKGSIISSGSISFYTGKDKLGSGSGALEENVTTITASPWVGYFIVDKVGIGLAINYSSSKHELDGSSSSKSSTLSLGPVVRFYPTDGGLFLQGYFGFGKDKSESGSFSSDSGLTEFLIAAGYSIRMTDTVLLDPMVGYLSQDYSDYETKSTRICVGLSFTVILSSE